MNPTYRICPHCKGKFHFTACFSEDGASVYEQDCQSCGKRIHFYIGADERNGRARMERELPLAPE